MNMQTIMPCKIRLGHSDKKAQVADLSQGFLFDK